jgi:hypothetical protein
MTQKFEVGRILLVDTCVEHWSSVGAGPNPESERRGVEFHRSEKDRASKTMPSAAMLDRLS